MIPFSTIEGTTAKPRSSYRSERLGRLARQAVGRAFIYLGLLIGIAIFTGPLYWMVASGLKPEGDVFEYPPNFFPSTIHWYNYPEALDTFPFVRSLTNSAIIIIGVELGRLITSSLAAFGFSRVSFPHRDKIFVLVLSTLMIPYHVTLIPQYLIFRDLGWLDSVYPLIVPNLFGGGAFFIFLSAPVLPDDSQGLRRRRANRWMRHFRHLLADHHAPVPAGIRRGRYLHLHVDVGRLPRSPYLPELTGKTHRSLGLPTVAKVTPALRIQARLESHYGDWLVDNSATGVGFLLHTKVLYPRCGYQRRKGLKAPVF